MKAVVLVIAIVVLVPLAAVTVFPLARYAQSGRETAEMDQAARRGESGSFVRTADGVTHYEWAGGAAGTPLVLIPGFAAPYSVWDPTFRELTHAGFRVLRYDLFGRGFSDRPAGAYDAAFFDRQLVQLLDALAIREPVDVAGVSMGGPIAVSFAARHPQRVRRVVLIGTDIWEDHPLSLALRMPLIGEYNMAVSIAPRLAEAQRSDFVNPDRFPEYFRPLRDQMRYRGTRAALLATMRHYISKDVSADYRRLGQSGKPVLLIQGRQDTEVSGDAARRVMQVVPQAQLHLIDGAGHMAQYERSELVNPLLTRFLD